MSMRSGRNSGAFTLVELLIASAIFVVVMLSLYSAFQTGIISYRRLDTSFAVYQTARAALNRLEADLKNSFAYSDSGGKSRFSGTSDSLDFFTVIDSFRQGQLQTEVCRAVYSYRDNSLIRRSFQGLDSLKDDSQSAEAVLALNIENLNFRYLNFTAGEGAAYQWQDAWPGGGQEEQQEQALPAAVMITFAVSPGSGEKPQFSKIIPLPNRIYAQVSPGEPMPDE